MKTQILIFLIFFMRCLLCASLLVSAADFDAEPVGIHEKKVSGFNLDPQCVETIYFDALTRSKPMMVGQEPPVINPSSHVIRIIGLDGVGWQILNIFLLKNEMPNLKRLLQAGSAAVLQTDIACSPVSWTTIATGKEAAKHGIRRDNEFGINPFFFAQEAVQTPRIWDMMQHSGIPARIGRYYFTEKQLFESKAFEDQWNDLKSDVYQSDYRFFITIVEATDCAQHSGLLLYMLRETDLGKQFAVLKPWMKWAKFPAEEIKKTFHGVDLLIGDLLERYPSDTLCIVSDHGMRIPQPYIQIAFNSPEKLVLQNKKREIISNTTIRIDQRIELKILEEEYKTVFAENKRTGESIKLGIFVPYVTLSDLSGTNEALIKQAEQELTELQYDKIPVLQRTSDGAFRFNQSLVNQPLRGVFTNFYTDDPIMKDFFHCTPTFGMHFPNDHGVFIAAGPAIKSGFIAQPLKVTDITPTVLYLTGLSVGRDMDGAVAESIIRSDYLHEHPVSYIDSYDELIPIKSNPQAVKKLSPEELKTYKQIGYPGLP